ncbi:hypothetical protein [Streptomyces thioluteus]|uniref:hypothetical protein n=1 Tax=Streptomyces thioluteus TaxID=66431 RepID=UPI003CD06ACA
MPPILGCRGTTRQQGRWPLTALLGTCGAVALAALPLTMASGRPGGGAAPKGARPDDDVRPGWGFTHTQYSADHGTPEAHAQDRRPALRAVAAAEPAHHGLGRGEPRTGARTLRLRVPRRARRPDAGHRRRPRPHLCGAPDWMKGGRKGRTDWSRLETAPDRRHYGDFARLAGTIARRYPDIRHFLVWNELKASGTTAGTAGTTRGTPSCTTSSSPS